MKKKKVVHKKKVIKKISKPQPALKKKLAVKKVVARRPIRRKSAINKATLSFLITFFVIGVTAIAAINYPKEVLDTPDEITEIKEEVILPKKEEKKIVEKEPEKEASVKETVKPQEVDSTPQSKKEKDTHLIAYLTLDADMTSLMKRSLENGKVDIWYSPGILEYLKKENIPATIFSTGMFAEVYPDLIKELSKNPLFSIQNHTYSHRAFASNCYGLAYAKTKEEKIFELTKTQEILEELTGKTPKYVRLPGLCTNKESNKIVKDLGFKLSNAGIVSDDAFQNSLDLIVKNVLNGVHEGENVIIMHLGGPNAKHTEEAIKIIIPKLKNMGYTFERL